MSTVNIHSKTFAATARLFGENNERGQFATVDLDDGDLDVRIFLGTPAMCDELIKAAVLAKSMLLGETSEPLPVLAEPPVSAQWAAPERTATPAEHADTAARIERARTSVARPLPATGPWTLKGTGEDAQAAEQLARELEHGADR